MKYEFDNERPIYSQMADLITKEIISGKLKPGQKLPSVREYAGLMKANPNTVCKALDLLEASKLIYTERTNGKFVTTDLVLIDVFKKELLSSQIDSFMSDMNKMGISKEEIINILMEKSKWVY